jgi:hypothetical protein
MRTDLSENRVSLTFFDNLTGSHQPPQKLYILENRNRFLWEPPNTGYLQHWKKFFKIVSYV